MQKIFLTFSIIFCVSLQADLSSVNYTNLYTKAGGFSNSHTYNLVADDTYVVTYRSAYDILYGKFDTNHQYKDNFKFFMPNFMKYYVISFIRYASVGWIDAFVSMDKKPFLGVDNEYTKGNCTVSLKKYGFEPHTDEANKFYFAPVTYHSKIWFDKMINGWTLRLWNTGAIIWNRNNKIPVDRQNELNKWVYVATDNRPYSKEDYGINSRSLSTNKEVFKYNPLKKLSFTIKYGLDKYLVDREVEKNGFAKKFKEECKNIEDDVKNICYYINAFGNGDNLAETYAENACPNGVNTESISLSTGWNLVSLKNASLKTDDKNVSIYDSSAVWFANKSLSSLKPSSIEQNKAVWIYTKDKKDISIERCQKEEKEKEQTLNKGWYMLNSSTKDIMDKNVKNECVEGMYFYIDSKWIKYSSDTFINIDIKDKAFWIKIKSDKCKVSF